ncbi:MAG TPA: hypothetical protein VJ729_14560 [Nitrososphaeraceae archaeon]|nr:hypothetical protein [Nitrososphaeraceae archaeon]
MKTTALLTIVAIIAAVGAVASVGFATMATSAYAKCNPHVPICDPDDSHGQSFHDIKGDLHTTKA